MYNDNGEFQSVDYNPGQERESLREDARNGMKYQAARKVLSEITDLGKDSYTLGLVLYLRVLKLCKKLIEDKIRTRLKEGAVNGRTADDINSQQRPCTRTVIRH